MDVIDLHPPETDLRADVLSGLRREQKMLPSKYLYDARGAALFEQICEQDEYYPTQTELTILRDSADDIAAVVGPAARIIEPGSGEGLKTRVLLSELDEPREYVPIDIARDQLRDAARRLNADFPNLRVQPICADFTQPFDLQPADDIRATTVFFPGSTVGNLVPAQSRRLLARLGRFCMPDGGILVGVDLIKSVETLEAAYDDKAGVSAEFALNILRRLNEELDANFDLDTFHYEATYNPDEHRIEMALVSAADQTVSIASEDVAIADGERILTEYSYKFSLPGFAELADAAELDVEQVWVDDDRLFSVQYLTPRKAAG